MKSFGGAMCITNDRQVLSIDRHLFLQYCLVSNTYTVFSQDFIKKRELITHLKASPFDKDIMAFGYKNGLIIVANLIGKFFVFNIKFRYRNRSKLKLKTFIIFR